MHIRKNEPEKTWFRGERCFSADGQWYLATREGVNIGPFSDQRAAQRSISLYLKSLSDRKDANIYASKVARDGVWASSNYR